MHTLNTAGFHESITAACRSDAKRDLDVRLVIVQRGLGGRTVVLLEWAVLKRERHASMWTCIFTHRELR